MRDTQVFIELTSSSMRILVGYLEKTTPVILYANSKPLNGIVKSGTILDLKTMIDIFKKELHVEDVKAKVKFNITHAHVILPPIGLNYFNFQRSVTCQSERITEQDVYSVINAGYKNKKDIQTDHSIVSIIIDSFDIDGENKKVIKIGESCDMFGISSSLYTLPTSMVDSYKALFESNSIKRDSFLLSPYCIAELLDKDGNYPKKYIYVDVGSEVSTCSLIDDLKILKSNHFYYGGSDLTKSIAKEFSIDFKDAEKIKIHYGYDSNILSYDPVISSKNDDKGEITFKVSKLNRICLDYFIEFKNKLELAFSKLGINEELPLVFGGGAIRLAGFYEYLKFSLYKNRSVYDLPLNVIGVRNQKYLNLVGALISTRKSVENFERVSNIVSNISSDEVK